LRTLPSSLRLGFAGTPEFAVASLDALARSTHCIVAVFTQPDRPAGRGRAVHPSPVKKRALALGMSVQQPASFNSSESHEILRSLRLDALVVVAYGLLLPPAALAVPRLGCFNVHASLLPRWRGAAPIQRAILAGDATTGVTIMRMEAGLDTGPTLAARAIEISPLDTAGSLQDRLAALGGALLRQTLDELAIGQVSEVPQPLLGVTYAAKIGKSEALIDWHEDAAQVLRRIRAYNPTPVAETRLGGAQLRIWEAEPVAPAEACAPEAAAQEPKARPGTVLRAGPSGIVVACGQGEVRIVRLQLAGRKPLVARDFIQARPLAGARFDRS
jgi:methionyl-tRNA formyltransferase